MKKSLIIFGLIILGTVGIAEVDHPMDAMLKTWIGTPVKELVKAWGNPTDIDYKRGQTVYKWEEEGVRYVPGTMLKRTTECERKIIVDITGRVVFGTFEGNGCPFTTEGARKWAKQ